MVCSCSLSCSEMTRGSGFLDGSIAPAACRGCCVREGEKLLEKAMAVCEDDTTPHLWERIAAMVAGEGGCERHHSFELLVEDASRFKAALIPHPNYADFSHSLSIFEAQRCKDNPKTENSSALKERSRTAQGSHGLNYIASLNEIGRRLPFKAVDQDRRKGVPWSEEEHKLFLLGLESYGKGDWRSISKNFVVTRTPTQVASHAQKYFIRQKCMNKDKRRTSIHDITNVGSIGSSRKPTSPLEYLLNVDNLSQTMPSLGLSGHSSRQPLLPATQETNKYCPVPIPHMDDGIRSRGFRQASPNSFPMRPTTLPLPKGCLHY